MSAPEHGWFADPTGRHQMRYWNGSSWTPQVSDNGQVSIDQPIMPPPADLPIAHPVSPTNEPPIPPPPPPGATGGAIPMPPPPPPMVPAPTRAPQAVAWGTVIGAVLAGASTLLAWFDFGGLVSINAFDVPFVFLFDSDTVSDSSISVGLVTVFVAALALLAGFVQAARLMGRMMGVLLIMVGAAFGVQVIQLANEGDISLTDLAGFGPVGVIVGGMLVLVTSRV